MNKLRKLFSLALVFTCSIAASQYSQWSSIYGGSWNSTSNWISGQVPNASRDAYIALNPGVPGNGFFSTFRGRALIEGYTAEVRNLYSNGTVRLINGQLNLYGGAEFYNGQGIEMSGSRLFAQTSLSIYNGPILVNSGMNYLDVWTGQTLNLFIPSFTVNQCRLRQSTWAYRPGSILNSGLMDCIDGEISLTPARFTNNVGAVLRARGGFSRPGIQIATHQFVNIGAVRADGGAVEIWSTAPFDNWFDARYQAFNGGKMRLHGNHPSFTGEHFVTDGAGSLIEIDGDITARSDSTTLWPGKLGSQPSGGEVRFVTYDALARTYSGGKAVSGAFDSFRCYSYYYGIYLDYVIKNVSSDATFRLTGNNVTIDRCNFAAFELDQGTVRFAANGKVIGYPWRIVNGPSTLKVSNGVSFENDVEIWGPTSFQTQLSLSETLANIYFKKACKIRSPLTTDNRCQFVSSGPQSVIDVRDGGNLPKVLLENQGSFVAGQTQPIGCELNVPKGCTLTFENTWNTYDSNGGFAGDISIDSGGIVQFRRAQRYMQGISPIVTTKSITINGKIMVDIFDKGYTASAGTTFVLISADSVKLGVFSTAELPEGWRLSSTKTSLSLVKE